MGAHDLLTDLAGAGLSVTAQGGDLVIRPASRLTERMRVALRSGKPELLALLRGQVGAAGDAGLAAVAWTDADITRFLERRTRLVRWGWTEVAAEALAERLVRRDHAADERVSCADCRHYRPGRCGNHSAALLTTADIGRDLAVTLQRCEGFAERKGLQ